MHRLLSLDPHSPSARMDQRTPSSSRLRRVLGVSVLALAAGAWFALDLVLCPFAAVTGWPCPGCGMTRACLALLQGQWDAAVHFHPLSPVVLPVLGLLALQAVIQNLSESPKLQWSAVQRYVRLDEQWVWWGLTAALLGVWVVRMAGGLGGPVPVRSLWSLAPFAP